MYAIFDTETTGFSRGGVQPRIVSIAWMIADNAKAPRVFKYSVIRPDGFTIPAPAAAVHGITTDRAMREGKPLSAVLSDFAHDLITLRPKALVAHNAAYDMPIVEAEFQMLGRKNPCTDYTVICTMREARAKWPGQSARLGDVYRRIHGKDMEGAHNAGGDVWACSQVLFYLIS